jgi:periplasmic protein TonB
LLVFLTFSRHTSASAILPRSSPVSGMSYLNTIEPKVDRDLLTEPGRSAHQDPKQRKLMVSSLFLLLLALSIVLWHDRDFWFPDEPEADTDEVAESSPVATAPVQPPTATAKPAIAAKPKHHVASAAKSPAPQTPPAPAVTTTRTVLPPLEVEVVAGDTRRTVRSGSSSVRVDLQPGTPPQPIPSAAGDTETAAKLTSDAAEHVQMSADASEIVALPVRPNYPLLARQMKVQGSVVLQVLIGKDGIIQNLRVVSGPHILAGAAEDAVRQWHFRPHFEGSEAVETQAKITVNFTISTN